GHGGVVIGSEMSGGVKKITISNCVFDGTDRGIRIKTARGRGGVVEEIRVDNIIMKNIRNEAIVLDMQYSKTQPQPVSERTPAFRNIHFSNITAETNNAGVLNGLEEMPIDDVTFQDIQIVAQHGFTIQRANHIEFHNVRISSMDGNSLKCQNVKHLELDGLKTFNPLAAVPTISLNNVEDVFVHNCSPLAGTGVFVQLAGKKTQQVTFKGNNFRNVSKPVVKDDQVMENIVID
ncbi:MAG TPA: glycosyl hydrolase family 28 protein, partial [Flavisolibacter sp.]|nr:glycosyl hydrolase family 28 protein [Flavisolibacter sp.]